MLESDGKLLLRGLYSRHLVLWPHDLWSVLPSLGVSNLCYAPGRGCDSVPIILYFKVLATIEFGFWALVCKLTSD